MKYTFEIEVNKNGKVVLLESYNDHGSRSIVDCENYWGDKPITIKEAVKLIEEELK